MNDCQILEISSDEQSSSLSNAKHQNEQLTAPPIPNFERSNVAVDNTEFDCMLCCCQYGAHGEMVSSSTSPAQNSASTQICLNSSIWKKCLSSTYLYLYVLFMTFICIFLLIMEVLLDSKALQVTPTTTVLATASPPLADVDDESTKHVSAVLHWISFTIICIFLIETILRLAVWKVEVIRNPIALCDSAVIVCAFTVNLTTSLAAGIDSPWDAISLLIIFRFVRIYSLLQGNQREMKIHYSNQIQVLQVDLSSAQIANVKLQKQIGNKDFEIKQLVAHLGGGGNVDLDEEIQRVVETSKLRTSTTSPATDYEARLQQAIERSKAEYGNGTQGFVNYSYTERSRCTEGAGDPNAADVIIHHRQNSVRRDSVDKPGTSKQFINPHLTSHVGTSSNEQDPSNLLLNNKTMPTSADPWNAGYLMSGVVVDKQPFASNQPLAGDTGGSSLKKLVKINPKQLHKTDKVKEVSRWIYKKNADDSSSLSSDDEGIESTPSSLKRKFRRSPTETLSTSTTAATTDSGTLSDHGFSSTEVDSSHNIAVAGNSPKHRTANPTTNNSSAEKQLTPPSSTQPAAIDNLILSLDSNAGGGNDNAVVIDDIELLEQSTTVQQQSLQSHPQNDSNSTVSIV